MRCFKLIQEYPGSPKAGLHVYQNGPYYQSNFNTESVEHFHKPIVFVENYPKIWEEVKDALYMTEDGVEFFSGDTLYYVLKNFKVKYYTPSSKDRDLDNIHYFSSQKKADEYVAYNKPLYSLKDIVKCSSFLLTASSEKLIYQVKKLKEH